MSIPGRVATLTPDADGFVGVALRFPYGSTNEDGSPLQESLKDIPGATWNRSAKAWMVPDVQDIPRGYLKRAGFVTLHPDGTPAKPSDLPVTSTVPRPPKPENPQIPEWFGLELYPYQRTGAIDVAMGKSLLTDSPGVGKTRTSLAAAAVLGSKRTLVLCPPVVLTHWCREIEASGLPLWAAAADLSGEEPLVMIKAGKKLPELPRSGVVVVSSALVATRPDITALLTEWQPTVMIFDEAHAAKTWHSKRSRVIRRLSRSCNFTIPTTGTPVLGSPLEMAPLLDMSGHLEPLFGTYWDFRDRFAKRGKWGWVPKKRELPALGKVLTEQVWVRRTKAEVLPDMPPKMRNAVWVDVSQVEYKKATAEVNELIDTWLTEYKKENGRWPSDDTLKEWCSGQLSMVSRLRQAAGLSKVEAAIEMITEWLSANPGEQIVVWAHHKTVISALVAAMSVALTQDEKPVRFAVIDGSVPQARRSDFVDEFQQGELDVLICSIQAAGVGITLTNSSEALFVETDWTPALVAQAEDRQHRIGQTRPVTYNTMIAAGTLDERVQSVLSKKADILDSIHDGDHHVFVSTVTERIIASDILAEMVRARIEKRSSASIKKANAGT